VQPELLINLVALTNVDQCEQMPAAAFLANVRVVENLAVAIHNDCPGCHLIQISTDQVYDGTGPHCECDALPKNYYALSKFAGEVVALKCSATVLRTNFIGPSVCSQRRSLSDWVVESLRNRKQITVFDDIIFSPLTIATLIRCIEITARLRKPGLFNLGAKGGMSKAEFALMLGSALGLPLDTAIRGKSTLGGISPTYRPKDMRMNSSRFETTFGVQLPEFSSEISSLVPLYSNAT
jgi:dTDP-4-dehydrorhamnose reductase